MNFDGHRWCGSTVFRCIGTSNGAGACLVLSGTVEIVFCFYHVAAFRQFCEEVLRGIVLRRSIGIVLVAGKLVDGLQTGRTAVDDLYEIEVAGGVNRDADTNAVADFKRGEG